MDAGSGGSSGIRSLSIKSKDDLYSAYMPFVNNGGLFIATQKSYKLGDEVVILLSLMDEPEKILVTGKVIWVTPKGAQGNRTAGIGIQFSDDNPVPLNKIETHLAGAIESDRPTHTMWKMLTFITGF